jgi:asparagine N-glycosylation enzyme membrane subunit Stt3
MFSLRAVVAGALIIFAAAIALPIGSAQTRLGAGPGPDWSAALEWMRWNTPEPMENSLAWYRWWPRLDAGARFAYPGSAYGILAPWDEGWWISGIARRIPTANGQQDGIVETSRFLTETQLDDALRAIRKSGARYVAIGPESVTIQLPSLVSNAGRRIDQYSRVFDTPVPGGQHARVRVYFPAFYRSMAARLYLFEGRRIDSRQTGVMVFLTSGNEETIHSVRKFASEKEAEQWIAANPYETANLASADPAASCVDLDEIPWLTRVFASSNERVVGGKQPTVVKIFELAGDTPP